MVSLAFEFGYSFDELVDSGSEALEGPVGSLELGEPAVDICDWAFEFVGEALEVVDLALHVVCVLEVAWFFVAGVAGSAC